MKYISFSSVQSLIVLSVDQLIINLTAGPCISADVCDPVPASVLDTDPDNNDTNPGVRPGINQRGSCMTLLQYPYVLYTSIYAV